MASSSSARVSVPPGITVGSAGTRQRCAEYDVRTQRAHRDSRPPAIHAVGWPSLAAGMLPRWPCCVRSGRSSSERMAPSSCTSPPARMRPKPTATLLVVGASTASLVGVGFALGLAGRESDALRGVLVIFAFCTVIVSWTVINTIFTLRYAHLHVRSRGHGIDFGPQAMHEQPTYRDFATVAFTIEGSKDRQAVLFHAFLAYLFGVSIVAGAISLIAGLVN